MTSRLTRLGLLIALLMSLLYPARPVFAQADQILPPMGGPGGGQFFARCEKGEILNGFELRTGDDVDSIRPICIAARAPTFNGQRNVFTQSFGGSGGGLRRLVCPDEAPAIVSLGIGYEGQDTIIVNSVHLYCSKALTNRAVTPNPTVVFDGPRVRAGGGGLLAGLAPDPSSSQAETCPQGLIPVGINGRSGIWLDAVGLICGALPCDGTKYGEPVRSIGRVGNTSAPRRTGSICDAARDARARNSPAAANLEAQCTANPPPPSSPPVTSIGKVATKPTPPAPLSADDLDAIMARGAALAMEDPLAAELRNRAPEGPIRRGFDIGFGIWEANTAPGPGKQRYYDALDYLEQRGFRIAANYSLPRNKHAALAAVGAAIAGADAEVAEVRSAEDDVMFWLGFDIASGIFGDPAAGSLGNTATGPGSLGIRKELNAAGRRGFDAATAWHLSRSYR